MGLGSKIKRVAKRAIKGVSVKGPKGTRIGVGVLGLYVQRRKPLKKALRFRARRGLRRGQRSFITSPRSQVASSTSRSPAGVRRTSTSRRRAPIRRFRY